MKKIITISSLYFSLIMAGSISPDKITKMIEEIKEERVGIKIEKLETTVNPFIIKKKVEENLTKDAPPVIIEEVVEVVYTLEAILNHAAFINKKWYKKGSKIDDYRVVNINKNSVTLKSSHGSRIIPLKKKTYMKLH